jgi:hypothetical protein
MPIVTVSGQRLLGGLTKEKARCVAVCVSRWWGGVNLGGLWVVDSQDDCVSVV